MTPYDLSPFEPAGPLHPPGLRGAHGVRLQEARPVHQAVRGADHLPRRADRRHLGQRRDGPAAHAGVHRPRPRHLHLHQLAGRLVHRADGDLRHHAVRQARHPDRVHRPGGLRGGRAARGRHPRQAARPAELPDPHPPALQRGRRPGERHRDPGQRDPADALAARGDDRPPQRAHPGAGQQGHRARQDPHAPRRPSSTAWSTGSSCRARRPSPRPRPADRKRPFRGICGFAHGVPLRGRLAGNRRADRVARGTVGAPGCAASHSVHCESRMRAPPRAAPAE